MKETISDFEMVRDNIMVEWVELGEGLCGDYNPDDPDDIELLRFDVSRLDDKEGWVAIDDASYCTRFPVNSTSEQQQIGLRIIMDRIFDYASQGLSIKNICEEISWIGLDDVERYTARHAENA